MQKLALLLLLCGASVSAFTPSKLGTKRRFDRVGSPHSTRTEVETAAPAPAPAAVGSAAERYTGAGRAAVDMNRYNVPLERAAEEWTAELTPKSAFMEEGIYLGARSKEDLFVDTLTYEIRRAGGLGIELLEIAGGREDGLGITIVSGLVEGGNAEGSGILPGDSIAKLAIRRRGTSSPLSSSGSGPMEEVEEETSVSTECLGYDATIDAILDMPIIESDDETVMVTVKRLRRKPRVSVKLQYPPGQGEPDATIELFAGENLRRAMLTRGVKLNDALSRRFDSGGMGDCGAEGTCATCVVGVTKGMDLISPIKIQEKQILEKNPSWRMACKAVVGHGMKEGEITLKINPRQWN